MSTGRTGPHLGRNTLRWIPGGLAVVVVAALVLGPRWIAARLNPTLTLAAPSPASLERAEAILDDLEVVDLHSDALLWDRDLLERRDAGHVDLARLVSGRVAVQMFTAVTRVPRGMNVEATADDSDLVTPLAILQLWPPRTWTSALERALHQADKLRGFAARSGGRLSVITTRDELAAFLRTRAPDEGTVAALLGVEGAHALEGDASNVEVLHGAGYRMVGLTHFFDNAVGGSAHGLAKGGLTPLGADVLDRLGELGMLVDLAHASPSLIDDVTARTEHPVVVSHTGVSGTCASPRNLSDEALLRIAATGGVVGIGLWPEAVCGETPAAWAAAVRYAADRVGVRHVALGSDWDGAVRAIVDATGTPYLAAALLEEGFSPDEIRAILGENTLRVLFETLPTGSVRGTERRRAP